MGKLLCEQNLRDVWCRNESVRAEIGPILQTHTHTRVSYSSIDMYVFLGFIFCILYIEELKMLRFSLGET